MSTPINKAAWLPASKSSVLHVAESAYTPPKQNQIVVKNGAIAINPLDYIKRDMGEMLYSWIKYPFVLGEDVAGVVVDIGPGVRRFQVGDRVVGYATGMEKDLNTSSMCGFQLYTVLQEHMTSPIPDSLSFEQACVLPLGLSTAACGLFQKDHLALPLPSASPHFKSATKTLLVWGGSTSVGSNAIQLAVAAGFEVFTTCSPRNFEYVKKLGATKAFDYNSKTVVADLIRAFDGKTTAGAISIGNFAAEKCMDVMAKCKGNRFVSMASYPKPEPMPTTFVTPRFIFYFISWSIGNAWKSMTRGIGYKFIVGSTLKDNEVGSAIFVDFLPEALAQGTFVASPEPMVIGKGLGHVQIAMDLSKSGVSAAKVVVTL